MTTRQPLSDAQVQAQLPAGWAGNAHEISREFTFGSYMAGVEFAVRVAQAADQTDHHPDLLISYKRVKVTFSTHDAGGVTAMDMAGAEAVNRLSSKP